MDAMSAVDSYRPDTGYEETEVLPEEDQEQVLDQEQEEEQEQEDQEEQEEEQEEHEGDLFGDEPLLHPQDAELRTAPTSEAPTTAGTTPTPGPGTDDGLTSPERRHRKALEYEEDDQEEPQDEEVQLRDANVQIPNVPVPRSSDDNYWVIRLPNFMKLDSKPFHPDMYVGPEQDDDAMGDADTALKERSLSIKLEVENTVRWRWTKDENGIDRKQSNSRVIRWSDGTMSLQLGKELFDVNQNIDTTGAAPRQMGTALSQKPTLTQSQSQSQSQSQLPSTSRGQGLTYLVAQHKRAEVLQAEKVITGYLTLRPTGMQSETHRKLVRAVGQKHSKVARLRLAPNELVQRDPDRELAELAKSVKKGGKTGRGKKDDGGLGLGRRRSGLGGRRREQMWSDDEEGPARGRSMGGSDSEDLDSSPKKGDGKKKERGEYQMDDFVVSDEEDDEDELGNPKSKKNLDKFSREKDALEEAEDRLEEEVRKRKKARGDAGDAEEPEFSEEEEEDKMDVESEEEEEENENEDMAIRKPRAGATKRKRVAIEEEDAEEE